ncbi:MAG TPA: GGDEF domain-containing protein [Microvirga sp.]|jgi:diguanylate cyclase
MQSNTVDIDRSFFIGQRAIELMKTYGSSADPRSYEVWYTYVSGHKPAMNDAIKKITAERGSLTEGDIERLHEDHLATSRAAQDTEKASTLFLGEIDQVMTMIEAALGSTSQYGESLQAFSNDLAGPIDRTRIRDLVASVVRETQKVTETNQHLEARLKETRGEIETLRETLECVRVEAVTDPVTGIANRKHFQDMLHKSVETANANRNPLALVVIDIDHFKRFNDLYGHLTGDQVLRLVSMTMREQVKSKATLARFGGEEFGIIMPETSLAEARVVAEEIRQSVLNRELVKRSTGESLGKITVSIGVSAFRHGELGTTLLERADQCMYVAKRTGRNRTVTDADHSDRERLSNVA